MTEKTKLELVDTDAERRPGYRILVVDLALGDGLTDTNWQTIPVDKPKDFFRVHPDPDYPPPHRNLHPQDRRPDRNGVLHSGAEDARAVAGGPALHSRYLHLP